MRIFINHIGYESADTKRAIFKGAQTETVFTYSIYREDGKLMMSADPPEPERPADWGAESYWVLDFTGISSEGKYLVAVQTDQGRYESAVFEISEKLITLRLMNALRCYFKGQRSSGEWLLADRKLTFQGSKPGTVDLHGGWFDATGDYGIHLSHLAHTGVFSPNQSALPAYVLFAAMESLTEHKQSDCEMLKRHFLDEAFIGASHCMRLRAPSGGFYRSVERGDAFAKELDRAVDYETFKTSGHDKPEEAGNAETITDQNYETALRTGAGIAIAVLALAAKYDYPASGYRSEQYLSAAAAAFQYFMVHNHEHTNDGTWNLLDEYTALLAAVELYRTTGEETYLHSAGALADQLQERLVDTDNGKWFEAVPGCFYFYPADEGMPVLALVKYSQIEIRPEPRQRARSSVVLAMKHVLAVTAGANPFGYARFCRNRADGTTETRFFFPHDTKASPWWQGENARIASLAAAARLLAETVPEEAFGEQLRSFADRQMDWIMGLNPYDSCMVEGYGRNNIQYFYRNRYDFMNCPGGVCNGITGGPDDSGISFVMEPCEKVDDNWRWAEQWLPHGAWFLYALALKNRKAR